ncbi:MAG: hypothetical protein IJ685_14435 [Selenomonadaceae bacterium]|nr:hypothetical protein [Selenomonadaceae bacterium]
MYKIIDTKDGAVIGRTETPLFIRKKETSGCYVQTKAELAQGVAYLGTPYNLQGRDGVGAEDTVILVEVDAGTEADKTTAALAKNSAAIDSLIISMLEG